MADVAIDKLSIEITGTSDSAVKSIDKLIGVLEKLDNVASSNKGLNEFEKTLEKLDSTLKKCDFTKLNDLKNAKLSATFGNNIKSLGDALHGISNTTIGKLTKISKSLQTFSSVKDLSINRRFINSIRELPQAFAEYAAIDMPAFVQQLDMLNGALTRIVPNVQGYANAVNSLPRSLRTAAAASRTVASTNRTLSNSFDISNASLKSGVSSIGAYFAKISGLALGLIGIKNKIMDFVDKSNSYIENMNLFTASMGSGAEAALEFAEKAQNLMGIDMGEWARNQGVFQTLITGMGETSENAEVMSQQLTQLGYDIASFYNMSVDDAMLKIQSGIAGELEPLRRIGWDLSDARMQIEVDDMGIEASTQQMSQAEKVALRYKMIMEQVTIVHGDMARTIASPANQLRVLQAQLNITARTIGNLFIPALNAILPYVIAIVKAVRILAIEIAKFFGIDATFEVDYSTLDTSGIASAGDAAADSFDDANDKAKELKNTVMGFDELNKLSDVTSSDSGKGNNGAGVGLDFELPTYDFFEGLTDMISVKTDEMAQQIVNSLEKILPVIGLIGAAFAAWEISKIISQLDDCRGRLKMFLGILMAIAGAATFVYNGIDAWNNGLNLDNFSGMIGGAALLVAGLAIAFGTVGAVIGAAAVQLGFFVTGMHDFSNNGATWENTLSVSLMTPIMGLLINLPIVGELFGNLWKAAENFFTNIGKAFETGDFSKIGVAFQQWGADIGAAFGKAGEDIAKLGEDAWNNIQLVWGMAFVWFDTEIAQPVKKVFDDVWGGISKAANDAWTGIQNWWNGLPTWFDTEIVQHVKKAGDELWTGISGAANTAWTDAQGAWSSASGWFDDNVSKPVSGFFNDAWTSISSGGLLSWIGVEKAWADSGDYFEGDVTDPIGEFFSGLWDDSEEGGKSAWSNIKGAWDSAQGWFNENVTSPAGRLFSGLWGDSESGAGDAWDGIQTVFSNVSQFFGDIFSDAWRKVCDIFTGNGGLGSTFGNIGDSIVQGFKQIVNNLIRGINDVINVPFQGLNDALNGIRNVDIMGAHPFDWIPNITTPQIPYLATGGQVNSGQLFVARENGIPEMVGRMGGQATVANNEQIVEGIKQGVVEAMISVMSLNSASSNDSNQPVEFVLQVGQTELGRVAYKSMKDLARRGEIVFV